MQILYRDNWVIAVNKPHGMLVHHTRIARDVTECVLQTLRDQIGQYVFPVHRLDRKTSGVLLFALDEESNRQIQGQFMRGEVEKKYIALVRGYLDPPSGVIDYPLKNENDGNKIQDCCTHFEMICQYEIPVPLGKHSTSRYSLVSIEPKTGRYHQIRKHFGHISHPIIGDIEHGCNKQNQLFRREWQSDTMYLHSHSVRFQHPVTGEVISIQGPMQPQFLGIRKLLETLSSPGNSSDESQEEAERSVCLVSKQSLTNE
jgi:tRNA pseudouridine65 synthase